MAAIFRTGAKLKELGKKYGKVALGVHLSVSAASITGLYVAIKSNVDVESYLKKVGMSSGEEIKKEVVDVETDPVKSGGGGDLVGGLWDRIRTGEIAATGGGAIAMAVLCNKALFPIRVPITIALTPPIARFLARRRIIQNSSYPPITLSRMLVDLCGLWLATGIHFEEYILRRLWAVYDSVHYEEPELL